MTDKMSLDIIGNAVKKHVQCKQPGAKVEIISTDNGTGNDDLGSSATSTLATYKVKANVDGQEETHCLFRKDMYEASEMVKEWVKNAQVYQKEVGIYTEWVPFLEEFQNNRGVTPLSLALPKYYDSEVNDDRTYIVLEHVGVNGFGTTKQLFLTYEEVVLALKELAKFHAIGHAVLDAHKDICQKFPFLEDKMANADMFKMGYYMFTGCYYGGVSMVKSVDPDLAQKMAKYKDDTYAITMGQWGAKDEFLSTIIHGDFWFNNILYSYKNGVPVDVRFVDFQMIRPSSVTTDLTYFLYTSTTSDLRKQHYRTFLQVYYESYISTLKHLQVEVSPKLTLEYLVQKMRDAMPYALVYMPFAMPMQLAGDPKDASTDVNQGNSEDNDVFDLAIPDEWKEADAKADPHLKQGQLGMAANLTKIMYLPQVQSRLIEFFVEMSDLGVI